MLAFLDPIADSFRTNFIEEDRYLLILNGLKVTIVITVFAVLLGIVLGGLVCWMRMNRRKWLQSIAKAYINIMRGTPVLVMLMIMYYVVLAPVDASGVVVAIITFAMNTAAYMCEMLRTGIEGIDKGQTEAGLSLGLTRYQTFFNIVLPQAVRNIIPVFQGEVISLLKSTSIVGYVAVMDLTKASDIIRARTFEAFFPLISVAVVYFLISWLIGLLLKALSTPRKRRKAVAVIAALPLLFSVNSCSKSSEPTVITKEDDLYGHKVSTLVGALAEPYIHEKYGFGNCMSFNNEVDALEALLRGKVDGHYTDDMAVTLSLNQHPELDTLSTPFPTLPIGACFAPENRALSEQFREFMDVFGPSEENKAMRARWDSYNGDNDCHADVEEVTGGDVLRVAISGTLPPFNFMYNNRYDGYEVELARRFALFINRPVEFQLMDFGAFIPSVLSGKVDMALSDMNITEERQKSVIQIPYASSTFIVLINTARGQAAENGTSNGSVPAMLAGLVAICIALVLISRKNRKKKKGNTASDTAGDDVLIRISHLNKTFDDNFQVLKDVNAEIRRGEVISIIGPSGTGKSTFLRCINLLETPSGGEIFISGENILEDGTDIPMLRRKMGMVFQAFNLFNGMTVLENITFAPMKLLNKTREEAEAKAMELLRLVGLAEKADCDPRQMSGGQKQRIAIARALAMEPEIILFDEPTSALDPTMVSEVLGVMRTLAKQGLTMMVVTHEMRFAQDVSSRVFYMDEGIIYESGTPDEIFNNPKREKTRNFIRHIREFNYDITSELFDFYEMMAKVNEFCVKYNMSGTVINHITHTVEECLTILGAKAGSSVRIKYSEKDFSKEVVISSPEQYSEDYPGNAENAIPYAMLKGICKDVLFHSDSTGSTLTCHLD